MFFSDIDNKINNNKMRQNKECRPTGMVEVFNFSEKSTPVRVQVINGEPWFVAKDIAEALGYSNPRKAINDHCKEKGVTFRDSLTEGGVQKLKYINEGNVYRLIINSNMPQSESFESWIFDEVLPSIRKRGYYGLYKPGKGDYIDARDIPYRRVRYNGGEIRVVDIGGDSWYSINDVNGCIGNRTESSQSVRRLNAKGVLARKIWLYGATQPGWFATLLGVELLLCASAKHRARLMLGFDGRQTTMDNRSR